MKNQKRGMFALYICSVFGLKKVEVSFLYIAAVAEIEGLSCVTKENVEKM